MGWRIDWLLPCNEEREAAEMTGNANPIELGAFLRARRQEVTPEMVGLSEGYGLRRVPGLRREEVAQLACISTDFYTRLEQGRRPASERVLDAIARALQLSEDETSYVFSLAGKEQESTRSRKRSRGSPGSPAPSQRAPAYAGGRGGAVAGLPRMEPHGACPSR